MPEIVCGRFQLLKIENLQVWPFRNQAIRWRKRKRNGTTIDASTHNHGKLSIYGAAARGFGDSHVFAVSACWTWKQWKWNRTELVMGKFKLEEEGNDPYVLCLERVRKSRKKTCLNSKVGRGKKSSVSGQRRSRHPCQEPLFFVGSWLTKLTVKKWM